jgi:hypothetical protein
MKLFTLLAAAASAALAGDLSGIQSIYVLPMSGGLDQHIAIRLVRTSWLQVVTDAKKADAILTDSLGEGFERRLAEINGVKPADSGKMGSDFERPSMRPLSHSRGNVFLVDRKTGNVLWSTTERPKDNSVNELMHAADRIVTRLEKDYKGK